MEVFPSLCLFCVLVTICGLKSSAGHPTVSKPLEKEFNKTKNVNDNNENIDRRGRDIEYTMSTLENMYKLPKPLSNRDELIINGSIDKNHTSSIYFNLTNESQMPVLQLVINFPRDNITLIPSLDNPESNATEIIEPDMSLHFVIKESIVDVFIGSYGVGTAELEPHILNSIVSFTYSIDAFKIKNMTYNFA